MGREGQVSGFWSYVHKDDQQVRGRILRLAELIRDEFALISGDDLEIFIDRESLAWGDQWRLRVDTALQETTFFIPIVTPRFFESVECRRELLKFATHARTLGAEELLLPILFVRVADLAEDSDDEAKALIARTQYIDWTDLRLTDETSEEYARAVNRLALRLSEIADEYATQPSITPGIAVVERDSDAIKRDEVEAPGLGDLIAQFEETLPLWLATVQSFPSTLEKITAITTRGTSRFESEGETFAKRVVIARDVGRELMDPAEELRDAGSTYASRLLEADPGVRAIIAIAGTRENDGDIEAACQVFGALRYLVSTAKNNEETFNQFIASLRGPSKTFRDMRPALMKMEDGMRSVLDAQTIMDEWVRLMDETPIDCSPYQLEQFGS